MLQSFRTRGLHREQDQQWDRTSSVKISTERGENGACCQAVRGQNSSLEVPNFTRTTIATYYSSIQTRLSSPLKDVCHPPVSPRFRIWQPESETSQGSFHTLRQAVLRDCPKSPSSQVPCTQEVGFPNSFCLWKLTQVLLPSRGPDRTVLGAQVHSCMPAELCGFIYVAFILCMKKHSSGIGFSYVRFLFLFSFFFF